MSKIGNIDVDPEKCVVALEALLSVSLGSHPWITTEIKSPTSTSVMVPEGLINIIHKSASINSAWLQYFVMKYLLGDSFHPPKNWTKSLSMHTLGSAGKWWINRPEDFRDATQELMLEMKIGLAGDPDVDNVISE
jgi:hypothetical protein